MGDDAGLTAMGVEIDAKTGLTLWSERGLSFACCGRRGAAPKKDDDDGDVGEWCSIRIEGVE
jgi:hypothetical protein